MLEAFTENIDGYVSDAEDRFMGGVSNLSEMTLAGKRGRHNSRIASFNKNFSKTKIQNSKNSLGVTSENFDPEMLGQLSDKIFKSVNGSAFTLDRYSLEESLLAIEQEISKYRIALHRAEYLPRFTSSIQTKAFDIDQYDGDMQVGLTLSGEFGIFDGGKSEAKIRALINKSNSVRRGSLLHKDLETRLASLKSQELQLRIRLSKLKKIWNFIQKSLSVR